MSLTIMHKDGSWTLELDRPVIHEGKTIDKIKIRPPDLSQVARFSRGEIPSSMAMLAEMCGVPEAALLQIRYPEVDRILTAYYQIIPLSIREASVPLVTPPELAADNSSTQRSEPLHIVP